MLPNEPRLPTDFTFDCTAQPDESKHPHDESCVIYFLCVGGRSIVSLCGNGTKFDRTSETCMAESLVTDCPVAAAFVDTHKAPKFEENRFMDENSPIHPPGPSDKEDHDEMEKILPAALFLRDKYEA